MSVLHGFRRHERRLARAVLALFCLVWLQLAAAPCQAVHATPAGEHARHAAPEVSHGDAAPGAETCPWCPPQDGGDGRPEGSRCAFPQGPQVDARLPLLFLPTPEAAAYPALPEVAPQVGRASEERAGPVPRRSFSISYCRFIE